MANHAKPSPGIRQHRGKWQVRYRDPSGKQRAKSFATKTDAAKYKAAMETDKNRGD